MPSRLIIDQSLFQITISRLCYQLIENHDDFSNTVLIGMQPRGTYLLDRISEHLKDSLPKAKINKGNLDVTFFRDDFGRRDTLPTASETDIDFIVEGKNVILIDDVLYTGRTIRAGLDAILAFGRPKNVELLVLVNRKFSRQLPIQADYVGHQIDTLSTERVEVKWKELDKKDEVWIETLKQ
ncbi:MAG: bifunctional pyr operon transcriptional regulator/uracil phosphoribosyltransferase PyrR [Bacteroidia bacterium]|nr:bifunctional pyr operon transcriptional regulator/uracil phosphoribosyltransferase PyrR [Bacteroidia bacterium]NNM16471.1 bifunctional pyr operon transcriptional regulator/uracil phosphoribosyltransferase PyrR [Bacteroidia bacterium]